MGNGVLNCTNLFWLKEILKSKHNFIIIHILFELLKSLHGAFQLGGLALVSSSGARKGYWTLPLEPFLHLWGDWLQSPEAL